MSKTQDLFLLWAGLEAFPSKVSEIVEHCEQQILSEIPSLRLESFNFSFRSIRRILYFIFLNFLG